MIESISLIGSGRLATALGIGFLERGIRIDQVFSRNIENAKKLAVILNAKPLDSLHLLHQHTDLLLLVVSDQAISEIASQIPFKHIPAVHCSGSQEMTILNSFERFGVLYPPQTFSYDFKVNLEQTPFFLEANDSQLLAELKELVARISFHVQDASSERRLRIHLAAVFANNFTNHFYRIAEDLLKEEELSLDILFPIMQETLNKLKLMSPEKAQTGPAMRNDLNVLEKHRELLKNHPDYLKIYSFVSESILNRKKTSDGPF